MKTHAHRALAILAACGAASCLAPAARAQTVINQSGATLLENFLKAPAATNDYFDVDGDGFARIFGTNDQLAPFGLPPSPGFGPNLQWWMVQYRAVGSVNGFQELVDFGGPGFVTTADNVQIFSNLASKAFHNRTQYITNGVASNAIFNAGNPGGAPVRSDTATLQATYQSPPNSSAGGIRIDMAPVDVPSRWAVQAAGMAAFDRLPGAAGYGTNPRTTVNKNGSPNGFNHLLASLGTRNLNVAAPNANTIFDTPIAFAPIAALTNLGTGLSQIDQSDLRHLFVTGRTKAGENLMVVTRDSGSGTRNGFNNSLCLDPSWGVGENIGGLSVAGNFNLLGPNFEPSNKVGSGEMESTTTNHRLAIGYSGAERGVNSGWLTGGRMEVLAVRNDLVGGAAYSRPNIDAILDNDANGYIIGGPAIFAHIGDPKAAPASKGGTSNGKPPMASLEAAAYLNNVTLSVAAFSAAPGGSASLFTPGEFLAVNYTLLAATDNIQDPTNPCNLIVNPTFNATLQAFIRANSTLKNPAYYTFGTVTLNGKVPNREIGPTYSDGVAGGANYVDQAGNIVAYGTSLTSRNRIAGDFSGDGVRDINDAADMVLAWGQRHGGPAWTAPTGSGTIAGAPGADASIEILGDFDGDGSFTTADARYWADGLAVDPTCGNRVNRYHGFAAVDNAFGGNFFATTKATGTAYLPGDSAGDVAGAAGLQTPGFAPVGADGAINAHDINYVYKQFRQNAGVTDGELNWDSTAEASTGDFSADINGDGAINQKDVCFLVGNILATTMGDVNLDGLADAADAAIASANLGLPGGWAQGDVDGDGAVTSNDQDIIAGLVNPCCPADFNADGFVDGIDYDTFNNLFEFGDCKADFNLDGFVDGIDYDTFNNNFEFGC